MRIMIDTNVLLSAIIFGSHTVVATILTASSGGNTLLLSTRSLEEARAVVTRKWPKNTCIG
ncbi:PIN domain-containing protein [Bifidobacterium sp. SO1]|uniref:PIN domain-containing protein n=1 Tax=Bifidobacterium sp. SO1 TaxID=2809029 RepID=UPI001BDC4355|nr:PIN domain-containing protein [Bifidobacterium sp. SO1]MBT1161943.1 PIN domain-containing protein [Bifidobacterium sp. SO1]